MLLDPVMDDDDPWVLIPTPADPGSGPDQTMPIEYRTRRFMLSNQVKDDVGKTDLAYDPPAGGRLEWVFFYLYERTEETGPEVYTPADIYREAILGETRRS